MYMYIYIYIYMIYVYIYDICIYIYDICIYIWCVCFIVFLGAPWQLAVQAAGWARSQSNMAAGMMFQVWQMGLKHHLDVGQHGRPMWDHRCECLV